MTVTLASGAPRLISPLCATAFVLALAVAAPEAQVLHGAVANNSPAATAAPAADRGADSDVNEVQLLVGRSTVLNVTTAITRVSLTSPTVADAMVTTPNQLLIHGKAPGTISMFVWDRAGGIARYEVVVQRDLSQLTDQLKALFPGERIGVTSNGSDVVISGTVTSKYVVDKAAEVAGGYVEKKEDVVNLLKQQEGVASNQVLLRVRFAEVSRTAMQELGVTFFANNFKSEWFGRTAPGGTPAPDFDSGSGNGLVFSDFLNLFVYNSKEGLGAAVKALQNKGLFQSLAEPNLVATNGKEASFLAGGEYPYPVVQSGSGNNAVTIMFKEFGVRLNFTPTVLEGDLINLKVRPEVSSLDFANAVTVEGFRVPALSTRRTETEVELRDGQTFAIAGLMNNTLTNTMSKIPGIGDIPILGYLFRSKAHQKSQTELVVMITPTIIRRGGTGASEGLPSLVEPYLPKPDKALPNPDAYTGSPRYPVTTPSNNSTSAQPAPAPAPAKASAPQRAAVARPAASQRQPAPANVTVAAAEPVAANEPVAPPMPAPAPAPAVAPAKAPSRDQQKAAERAAREANERTKKAAEEQARLDAERDKQAKALAEAERRKTAKLEKELAERQAEADRRNAEVARKKAVEDEKKGKALADAATRLKDAQAAYEKELQKTGAPQAPSTAATSTVERNQ